MVSRMAAVKAGCPTSKLRRNRSKLAASCSKACKRKKNKTGAASPRRSRRKADAERTDLRPLIDAMSASLKGLTESTASIVAFVNQIRNDVNTLQNQAAGANSVINVLETRVADLTAAEQAILPMLQARIGSSITVETPSGTVLGTLVAVGEDYAEIREPGGTIVIVRVVSIISIV
ncbi:DUF2642 domain-containing protein [Cohnella sp. GCM10020058]|uniref:DUF2642 domain-containing protein n=1 Tax=Cohnella sp. GCM10020058 TaxID=3317330 RepID=UPI00362D2FB6